MKNLKITKSITNRDSNSFKKYLLEVSGIKVLTTDEEYELATLAQQCKDEDNKYLDLLIKHNLRFVISVAKQYATSKLKLEDLVNEGNYGLITAARRYDASKGFKFISYAVWWIRRGILAYIAEHGRTIRIPNNKNNVMQKIKSDYDLLEQKLERLPTYDELIDQLDGAFTDSEIAFFMDTIATTMISLDAQIHNDGSTTSYSDLIKDENVLGTDHLVNTADSNYNISKMLGRLKNDNERQVLTLLFGLDGEDTMKLKTVALVLDLTSERVRQIRDAGLIKLRDELR